MKLLSWNLNGRRAEARRQVDAVVRRQPDIVAFQEVTGEAIGILRRALIERALPFALNSFELQESRSRLTGPRQYRLLTAGRMPFEPVLQDFRVPQPERVLAAQIRLAAGPIRIYVAHVPVNDFAMIPTVGFLGLAIVTDPASRVKSVQDLIKLAKAEPGKYNIASISVGSTQYLAAALFRSTADIDMQLVDCNG